MSFRRLTALVSLVLLAVLSVQGSGVACMRGVSGDGSGAMSHATGAGMAHRSADAPSHHHEGSVAFDSDAPRETPPPAGDCDASGRPADCLTMPACTTGSALPTMVAVADANATTSLVAATPADAAPSYAEAPELPPPRG